MAKSDFSIDATNTGWLNAVYKGLYLLNSMGQFSKDEQIRDDLSVRMSQLSNKLSVKLPSDINRKILSSIDSLAGAWDDPLVLNPYNEALQTTGEAIISASERREETVDDFFLAKDQILKKQERAKAGYYESGEAIKALSKVEQSMLKNAGLLDVSTRAYFKEQLSEVKSSLNIMSLLESMDIDKKMEGVQLDPNMFPNLPMAGESLQDVVSVAEMYVEGGQWDQAMESITKFQKENKLLFKQSLGKNFDLLKGSSNSAFNQWKNVPESLIKSEEGLKALRGGMSSVNQQFLTLDPGRMSNPVVWKRQYEDIAKGIITFLKDVDNDYEDIRISDLSGQKMEEIVADITGVRWATQDYGESSDAVAEAFRKQVRYLQDLNKMYSDVFGKSLVSEWGNIEEFGKGLPDAWDYFDTLDSQK